MFHHEGKSCFNDGIMISKHWRKFLFAFNLDVDVTGILENCDGLSKFFAENIKWTNGLNSGMIRFSDSR